MDGARATSPDQPGGRAADGAGPAAPLHLMLARQLASLGLAPDTAPDAGAWAALLASVSASYTRADAATVVRSRRDDLTGLPNRVALLDLLDAALSRLDPAVPTVAVLFVDLDGFKLINDTQGHAVGDLLLVQVARLLQDCVRDGDVVARMGGDEFVVLCPACDEATADAVAARVATVLDTPIAAGRAELFVTASVGVAVTGAGSDGAGLLRDADLAMYEAKARGRSQFVRFDERMRHSVAQRVATEAALHHALDDEELVVHYQPIVRLSDDEIVGAEALVRWERPGHGLVPADSFIALAERSRLIRALDRWVLQTACRDAVAWADPTLTVSVNLSDRDLQHDDTVRTLGVLLHRAGLPPSRLIVELTEPTLMSESPAVMGSLAGLRALGVSLALDDFGTGHSSLSALGRLRATTIKIDSSFVAGLAPGTTSEVIVSAIITMAHALGLTVIAEGVERPVQAERLRALGCDGAQGTLFHPPLPAAAMADLVAVRRVPAPRGVGAPTRTPAS